MKKIMEHKVDGRVYKFYKTNKTKGEAVKKIILMVSERKQRASFVSSHPVRDWNYYMWRDKDYSMNQ